MAVWWLNGSGLVGRWMAIRFGELELHFLQSLINPPTLNKAFLEERRHSRIDVCWSVFKQGCKKAWRQYHCNVYAIGLDRYRSIIFQVGQKLFSLTTKRVLLDCTHGDLCSRGSSIRLERSNFKSHLLALSAGFKLY